MADPIYQKVLSQVFFAKNNDKSINIPVCQDITEDGTEKNRTETLYAIST